MVTTPIVQIWARPGAIAYIRKVKEVVLRLPANLMGNSARAEFGFTLDDAVYTKSRLSL